MPTIALMMHRKAVAQGLLYISQGNQNICLVHESEYSNAKAVISRNNAKVALIEVAETGPYDMVYCLALCKELRKQVPECKLLMMCPEKNEESIKWVIDAKGEKQIDDFVFYDVSNDYLLSKLMSI